MPKLTDKQRKAALAADVEAHKDRSVRQLQQYLLAHQNDAGKAIYIVADDEDRHSYDNALIDTRCPDVDQWFGGNQRDVKSARALLNKTDFKKRALVPEALEGYRQLVVDYVRELQRLNAMKNAKQASLV